MLLALHTLLFLLKYVYKNFLRAQSDWHHVSCPLHSPMLVKAPKACADFCHRRGYAELGLEDQRGEVDRVGSFGQEINFDAR